MKKKSSTIRQSTEYKKLKTHKNFTKIESEIKSGKNLKAIAKKYKLKYYQIRLISPIIKKPIKKKILKKKPILKKKAIKKPIPKQKPKKQPKQQPQAATPKPPKPIKDKSRRSIKLKDGSQVYIDELDYDYDPPVDIKHEGVGRVIAPLKYDIPRLKLDYNNPIRYVYTIYADKFTTSSGIGYTQFANATELRISLEVAITDTLLTRESIVLVYRMEVQITELVI